MANYSTGNSKGRPAKGKQYNKLAAVVRSIAISARELPPIKPNEVAYYLTAASVNKRASNSKI